MSGMFKYPSAQYFFVRPYTHPPYKKVSVLYISFSSSEYFLKRKSILFKEFNKNFDQKKYLENKMLMEFFINKKLIGERHFPITK